MQVGDRHNNFLIQANDAQDLQSRLEWQRLLIRGGELDTEKYYGSWELEILSLSCLKFPMENRPLGYLLWNGQPENEGGKDKMLSIMDVGDYASYGSFSRSIGENVKRKSRRHPHNSWMVAIEGNKPISEISKRVLSKLKAFSKFLGISFEGYEDLAWKLFTALEKRWLRKGS